MRRDLIHPILSCTLIPICMLACRDEHHANFEISNGTGWRIDSFHIFARSDPWTGDEEGVFITVGPWETEKYIVDMTDIATDGEWAIGFLHNGAKRTLRTGYYSNGNQPEKLLRMRIESDTILYDYVWRGY